MSCVCILAPVVVAAWPAFSAAVVAAATSLGYVAVAETANDRTTVALDTACRRVELEMPQSEIVTAQLQRDQQMTVRKDGISITFARDARGKVSLCVEGAGHSQAALEAAGQEMSGRVIQQYVYQRLRDEMRRRDFLVVEEETSGDNAIRLKVRRWDN